MSLELPEGVNVGLDLGDDHALEWINVDGRTVGALVWHNLPRPATEFETPWCCGSVLWAQVPGYGSHPIWTIEGEPGPSMTLSPSILCSCGDHGYVRGGRWQKA